MTSTPAWGPGEIIGGYRLLRRLGGGEAAEVWLAAPAIEEDGERVALKLVRDGPERVVREAEALWRARGPHVVRLRDVVPLAHGTPFLILDAVPHELETVLAHGLTPGGVVTVLVPIAQELARLHDVGVAHGGIRLAAVGLDRRGSPVLLAFGAARTGPVSAGDRDEDLAAFAALALVILAAVGEHARDAEWHRLTAWFAAGPAAGERWLAAAIERCYRLADPEPLALSGDESLRDLVHAVGTDLGALGAAGPAEAAAVETSGRLRRLGAGVLTALPRRGVRVDRGRQGTSRVRARFWLPAAAAVVGLVVTLQLPPPDTADAVEQRGAVTGSPVTTRSSAPPTSHPTVQARVLDRLGAAFIVEVDGRRGPERLVIVEGPEGWQVRDYVAAAWPAPTTRPVIGVGSDSEHAGEVRPLEP